MRPAATRTVFGLLVCSLLAAATTAAVIIALLFGDSVVIVHWAPASRRHPPAPMTSDVAVSASVVVVVVDAAVVAFKGVVASSACRRWNRDVCVDSDHLVLNGLPQMSQLNVIRLAVCLDSICLLRAACEVNLRTHREQTRSAATDVPPPERRSLLVDVVRIRLVGKATAEELVLLLSWTFAESIVVVQTECGEIR